MTALGYLAAGLTGSVAGLCAALAFAGAGSSVQHPIASTAVARAHGQSSRAALGTYNFSGDLGKAAIPAALSLLIVHTTWHKALGYLGVVGLSAAALIAVLMPASARGETAEKQPEGRGAGGFPLLMGIGILDSSVRMGLLTFLPFLLKAKGADLPMIGVALALVFIGGAAGKFTCGWLGSRIGVLWTVVLTEGATAAFIFAVLALPLHPTLFVLPLLGVMLNGTSSVLYGTVPELAPAHRAEHAFALFYTCTIGAGALSPVLFGLLGDATSARWATAAAAITALATLPLAFALAPRLRT
jgi:FSR family fosmidomycin resistance protein-like MFS transporter